MSTKASTGRDRPMRHLAVSLAALILASLTSDPVAAAKAPIRETYFTLILGLDAPYGWQADCLRFTSSELCTLGATCGG